MTTFTNNHIKLFSIVERLASKGWRGVLENTRHMMGLYSKVLLCVFGRLSTGHCLAVYSMSKSIYKLSKASGPLFAGMYLKQVSFLLMKYIGNDKSPVVMKTYVKTSKSGIPLFIPPLYRKLIRNGTNPKVIQVVLSVCTLSKIILVASRVSRFRIDSSSIYHKHFELCEESKKVCKMISFGALTLFKNYVPSIGKIPLNLGFTFRPSLSSGPNTYKNYLVETNIANIKKIGRYRLSVYHTFCLDALAAFNRISHVYLRHIGGVLFPKRSVYCRTSMFGKGVSLMLRGSRDFMSLLLKSTRLAEKVWTNLITREENGRFGRKLEGSGKVRVFAIANPIFQALLRPLHDWAMFVLSTIPMDGTYDQHRPLTALSGHRVLYSFDLKSATDMFPLDFSFKMLESLFGLDLGDAWRMMMRHVSFRDPSRVDPIFAIVFRDLMPEVFPTSVRSLRFTRGQPLGYYSSWPIFTLTHHMFVWMAALRVYPKITIFKHYALLGDDIVIADKAVADKYYEILNECQIPISREKSLISDNGTCEFAKRFIVNNHLKDRMDLSPLSIKLIRLSAGFTSPFVFRKLNCSFLNSFRLRGGGYRVFSRIRDRFCSVKNFNSFSLRWRRHWISMFTSSGLMPLPASLWLAFPEKGILNCYELGLVRYYILTKIRPRDLNETSFDFLSQFWLGVEGGLLKESIITPFLKLHFEFLEWYYSVMFDYSVSIDKLLQPPIAPIRVERSSDCENFVRYGLLFKSWDIVRQSDIPKGIIDSAVCGKVKDFIYMSDPKDPNIYLN